MTERLLTSLLATKLSIPRSRRTLVVRPRLIKLLDTSRGYPLTLVAAPAGFGKTTLLAGWASQSSFPVAWLTLDAGDNDPGRFWRYVIQAMDYLCPGSGGPAAMALDAPEGPAIERVLTELINALTASSEDLGLILDDYQTIGRADVHAGVAFLLDHAPANLHLIIATRVDPLLPLARFRARDAMLEVRAADLRFNASESAEFLQDAMRLPVTAEQAAVLEAYTEGWIAGLQLAALALAAHGPERIPEFIAASVGSNRYVIDYLVEEVLNGLDGELQDFLCQTAILDRLSPAVCEAVTGRADSAAMLARLERANLFVLRLDPDDFWYREQEASWYRYHHPFADVLRKVAHQRMPELLPELHRRASRWYRNQRMLRDAIGHALAIPDRDEAERLIEEAGIPVLSRDGAPVPLEWLKSLFETALAEQSIPNAQIDRVSALPAPGIAGKTRNQTPEDPNRPGEPGIRATPTRAALLVEPLSRRELEVLRLIADGLGNRDIAERLIVSVGTVKSHVHSIYGKLGAQDRGHAVIQAHELRLL